MGRWSFSEDNESIEPVSDSQRFRPATLALTGLILASLWPGANGAGRFGLNEIVAELLDRSSSGSSLGDEAMACMFIMAFVWPVPLALAALGAADPANAPAPEAAPTQLIQAVGDAVLAHQIDPPSRQEMICSGIKAASNAAGVPVPAGLGRRVSAMAAPEQFAALVEETWPWSPERKETTPERLTYAFIEGMLQAIPSETRLFTAKEAKVHEQLQGNLYVGIHVQIDFDLAETRPKIVRALEGAPHNARGFSVAT